MKVILFIVMTLGQPCADNGGGEGCKLNPHYHQVPTQFEMEMTDIWECLREASDLTTRAWVARRTGKLQAGCIVIGPDKEASH